MGHIVSRNIQEDFMEKLVYFNSDEEPSGPHDGEDDTWGD
jgi:hypothetical protein